MSVKTVACCSLRVHIACETARLWRLRFNKMGQVLLMRVTGFVTMCALYGWQSPKTLAIEYAIRAHSIHICIHETIDQESPVVHQVDQRNLKQDKSFIRSCMELSIPYNTLVEAGFSDDIIHQIYRHFARQLHVPTDVQGVIASYLFPAVIPSYSHVTPCQMFYESDTSSSSSSGDENTHHYPNTYESTDDDY